MSTSNAPVSEAPPAWMESVAKWGWVARGVSYVIVGGLAVQLVTASSAGAEDADQGGALQTVADTTFGSPLVAVLAVGLGLFAAGQFVQLVTLSGHDLHTWLERAAKVIGIFFYGSLVVTSVRLLLDEESSSQWTVERVASWALRQPAGRVAVAAAALVVAAVALRRGRRTVTGDLDDGLDLDDASPKVGRTVEGLGRIGEVGRALSFLIISWFLLQAAWTGRSEEAGGLDESLAQASRDTPGWILVIITGLGFIVFGLHSMASAPYRELVPDAD